MQLIYFKTLCLACCDFRLYSVEAESGNISWNFFSGGLLLTSPVVIRQQLVIISADIGWIFGLTQKVKSFLLKSTRILDFLINFH